MAIECYSAPKGDIHLSVPQTIVLERERRLIDRYGLWLCSLLSPTPWTCLAVRVHGRLTFRGRRVAHSRVSVAARVVVDKYNRGWPCRAPVVYSE